MDGHIQAKRWRIINIMAFLRATMPFLQCKPSMLRGISPTNNEITKYKVCLNLHGRKQQYGVHYYETYSPVVTWFAVKIMITCSIHFGWSFCQVDFIQAYSQAPIEYDIYMKLPQGIVTHHGNPKDHALQLLANPYCQKQGGRV